MIRRSPTAYERRIYGFTHNVTKIFLVFQLGEVGETLAAMGADGVDDPDVLEATSKVFTGLLALMDQVMGGMDGFI